MKGDVTVLIEALTSERNALDRAIAALKCITPQPSNKAATTVRQPRHLRQRARLSVETKAAVVERMEQASLSGVSLWHVAQSASKEFGGSANTIQTAWRRWQRDNASGTAAQASQERQPTEIEIAAIR